MFICVKFRQREGAALLLVGSVRMTAKVKYLWSGCIPSIHEAAMDALDAVPFVFVIAPQTDYNSLFSHSANELNLKSWTRTADQMRSAFLKVESDYPDVRKKLGKTA